MAGCYNPRDTAEIPPTPLYERGAFLPFKVDGVLRMLLLKAAFKNLYDLTCEICGCEMIEQKCKIKCPNCGFTRDCSDP